MNRTVFSLPDKSEFRTASGLAIRPEELTDTINRKLRITLPEGIAGPRHA